MGSHVPVMIEAMNKMIYEINQILNYGCEINWSYDPRSY